jgi:hypothetical protein
MAKKEGFTAGAIVLAGVLLHPFTANNPPIINAEPAVAAAKTPSLVAPKSATGEGPWNASCLYWAPARHIQDQEDDPADATITHTYSQEKGADQYSIRKHDELSCPDSTNRWGIPTRSEMMFRPTITTAIAIVPDPLHAHASLEFDRSIDALLQAAADNNYVESYYWLPWRKPEDELRENSAWEMDAKAEKHERERKPGLIVLKRQTNNGRFFGDVVYLFLVSGTPVQGIYGPQLENALKYEGELQCMSGSLQDDPRPHPWCPADRPLTGAEGFTLHTSVNRPDELAIIGVGSTGEAASLWQGLQNSSRYVAHSRIAITGQTSSPAAFRVLNTPSLLEKPTYTSFRASSPFTEKLFETSVKQSGHDLATIAYLVEDSTALGQSIVSLFPNIEVIKEKTPKQEAPKLSRPVTIRFPRGISLLRNAHRDTDATAGGDSNGASPFLKMSLRDSSVEDTVTHFSGQTPLSQEAELMAIVRQLRRYRTQFVSINASDNLDEIFLAEFLHRTLPDVRLVSLGGADLLYERDSDNYPFIGGLTFTTYNLIAPIPSFPHEGAPLRAFSSEEEQAIYNSASYMFWDGRHAPAITGFRDIFNPTEPILHASLWLTAIGRDGYVNLGKVSNCTSLPSFANPGGALVEPFGGPKAAIPCDAGEEIDTGSRFHKVLVILGMLHDGPQDNRGGKFPVGPALSWFILCGLASLLCLTHIVAIKCADVWSPFTRDLAIDKNDEPCRRALYIHIGAVMLFCISSIVAYPMFSALPLVKPPRGSLFLMAFTILCGLACLAVSSIHIWPHTFGRRQPIPLWTLRNIADRILAAFHIRYRFTQSSSSYNDCEPSLTAEFRALSFFHCLAFVATLLIPAIWIFTCEQNHTAGQDQTFTGVFFSYRCLNPLSGVSPLPPVLLLLLGWFVWSTVQTRRLRFSPSSQPILPDYTEGGTLYKLYVTHKELAAPYRNGLTSALFRNVHCLLITRELLGRHVIKPKDIEPQISDKEVFDKSQLEKISLEQARKELQDKANESVRPKNRRLERIRQIELSATLLTAYLVLFSIVFKVVRVESLEHILFAPVFNLPTPYESLLKLLFFPLIMVTITGWIRMMLVWNSLHRGLLFQLETRPIRNAFSRIRREGWMSMLRQSGLEERWREMSRSLEAMRQMAHCEKLEDENPKVEGLFHEPTLKERYDDLLGHIEVLIRFISIGKFGDEVRGEEHENTLKGFFAVRDRPEKHHQNELLLMYLIEAEYAAFAQRLLERPLMRYWNNQRAGTVKSEEAESVAINARKIKETEEGFGAELHAGRAYEVPEHIQVAEEFVVIRYISLIRAVLVNLRQIMTFVCGAFALSLIAWNTYPFRPREWIDTVFTGLLILLMGGIIWIFAQIHRDPILSRITKTEANELGGDFYLRVAAFGAAPLLTWLAYQFPAIGNTIMKFAQPGLEVIK